MAACSCPSALQASTSCSLGAALSLEKDLQRSASPRRCFPRPSTRPLGLFCGCPQSEKKLFSTRAVQEKARAFTSESWDERDTEALLEGAAMLAFSDPASSWEEELGLSFEDTYNNENSPAHWIQEWDEYRERDMHRAEGMMYSAVEEGTCCTGTNHSNGTSLLMGLGVALSFGLLSIGAAEPAAAAEVLNAGQLGTGDLAALFAQEPANALSLPTWVIHVASVVEWVTAIALVWRYGDSEEPGRRAWKGLAWGMVPLLAGALCACTWHFFYNAPSLEIVVALQGFFTVLGNCTLWAAAYRIYQQAQKTA